MLADDLSPAQRTLLRRLRRARYYSHPLSVEVSYDRTANDLAAAGVLHIEPCDDLGLTWVTVTDHGRELCLTGGLWGAVAIRTAPFRTTGGDHS